MVLRSLRNAKYMTFWKKKVCRQRRLIGFSNTTLFGSKLSPLCGTASQFRSPMASESSALLAAMFSLDSDASQAAFLRRNCRPANPTSPMAKRATVLASGTAVAAENENSGGDPAGGSCVEKRNVPGVGSKPCPEALPVPVTKTKPDVPGVPP